MKIFRRYIAACPFQVAYALGGKIYTHMHFQYVNVYYPYIHAIYTYTLEYIHICTCRFTDALPKCQLPRACWMHLMLPPLQAFNGQLEWSVDDLTKWSHFTSHLVASDHIVSEYWVWSISDVTILAVSAQTALGYLLHSSMQIANSLLYSYAVQISSAASSLATTKFVSFQSGCLHVHEKWSTFYSLKTQCHLSSCGALGRHKQNHVIQESATPINSSESEEHLIKLF